RVTQAGVELREALRDTFRKGVTRPLEWRKQQLLQLARLVQENADAFAEALAADLGKPRLEAFLGEIGPVLDKALTCVEKLEEWSKPIQVEVPDWQKSWNPTIYKRSKGTVLIISYVVG
ncbi:hypothetical protein C0993_001900, partial [Termitomyces sp. T159_Od127]